MPLWVRTVLVTALAPDAESAMRGHVDHLRELRASGRLRAAGSFTRGDGFLDIFEAADLLEAESVARSSPLVDEGLAAWTLREWVELGDGP